EAARDRQCDPRLAARLRWQLDLGHSADLDTGQPHRRPLEQAPHLGELGDEVVLALEIARLGAEEVDDREENEETGEDEGADPDLQGDLSTIGHSGQLARSSPARNLRTSGLADRWISAGRPTAAQLPGEESASRS